MFVIIRRSSHRNTGGSLASHVRSLASPTWGHRFIFVWLDAEQRRVLTTIINSAGSRKHMHIPQEQKPSGARKEMTVSTRRRTSSGARMPASLSPFPRLTWVGTGAGAAGRCLLHWGPRCPRRTSQHGRAGEEPPAGTRRGARCRVAPPVSHCLSSVPAVYKPLPGHFPLLLASVTDYYSYYLFVWRNPQCLGGNQP